jgi:hypothetical protein
VEAAVHHDLPVQVLVAALAEEDIMETLPETEIRLLLHRHKAITEEAAYFLPQNPVVVVVVQAPLVVLELDHKQETAAQVRR